MKRIALVSVTLNGVNPMTNYLSRDPDLHIVNYLDSAILEIVRREGHITDACMRRMVTMLAHACEDGADGIIVTCTIFTAYVPQFRKLFRVPIVAADAAMMEQAGQCGGKTALVCTFEGTKAISENLLRSYCEASGKPFEIVPFVLPDAYEAAQQFRMDIHDRIIWEKVKELDPRFDQIVLAQISMSGAVLDMQLRHGRLFTSPSSAYAQLMRELGDAR